jgi:hypothetical protein
MKIFCLLISIIVFITQCVRGSEGPNSLQKAETKERFRILQEISMTWIRKNTRATRYIAVFKVPLLMSALDFLTELKSVDDLFLILAFYSYGTVTTLPFSVGKIFEMANQSLEGKRIFDKIIDNYKKYLYQKIIEANDQEAVTQAMAVYRVNFHSIWRKLVCSDFYALDYFSYFYTFDYLDATFLYLQAEMGKSIYELLEYEFSEFFKGLNKKNRRAIDLHGERFRLLAYSLSKDEGKCFGLKWIVEKDPFLVLFYFYCWNSDESTAFTATKGFIKQRARNNLRDIIDKKYIKSHELMVFDDSFKNPFPAVIEDDELKTILYQLSLKIFDLKCEVI